MAQNVVTSGGNPARIGVPSFIQFGQPRRRSAFQAAFGVFFAPIPGDAIGSCVLTLANVAIGSRVVVMDQAGTTVLYDQLAAASTVVITLSVYSPGDALNNLRIRVRKSSAAPKYLPFETLTTITTSPQGIYVSQIPDTIAS